MPSKLHGCWQFNCMACCSASTLRHAEAAQLPLICCENAALLEEWWKSTQQVASLAAPVLTLRDNAHAQGPADAPSLLDSVCRPMPDLHMRRLLLVGRLLLGQADEVTVLGCRRRAPKG